MVAIIIMTIIAYVLKHDFGITGIETIGDRFTHRLLFTAASRFTYQYGNDQSTVTGSFYNSDAVGAIESLLSATVADGVTGR